MSGKKRFTDEERVKRNKESNRKSAFRRRKRLVEENRCPVCGSSDKGPYKYYCVECSIKRRIKRRKTEGRTRKIPGNGKPGKDPYVDDDEIRLK